MRFFFKFICDSRIIFLHVNVLIMNLFLKILFYFKLICFILEGLLNKKIIHIYTLSISIILITIMKI